MSGSSRAHRSKSVFAVSLIGTALTIALPRLLLRQTDEGLGFSRNFHPSLTDIPQELDRMSLEHRQFDFGENWQRFSHHALSVARVAQACTEFQELIAPIPLKGRSFLDIGFGQGLTLLAAASLGAHAIGCEISPKCSAALARNIRYFPDLEVLPCTVIGSILDSPVVEALFTANSSRPYDVVHSWGALHHTGNMRLAIEQASRLVAPEGYL